MQMNLGAATRAVAPGRYIRERLAHPAFAPHPALPNSHAQTILASILPRKAESVRRTARRRVFQTAPDAQIVAECHWASDGVGRPAKDVPTLLLLHGIEGSIESSYMLGVAEKALRAGFHAIRINTRACGGTEDLSLTFYNAGLTADARAIIAELEEADGLTNLYVIGFSLSGNVALKLAGEYGARAPRSLRGVAVVSPSVDLALCAQAIESPSNFIYQRRFVNSLKRRLLRKAALAPGRYDVSSLSAIRTIRQFDDAYIAREAGYRDASDYYAKASALPFVPNIKLPTLIVHAQDDPFIPYAPLLSPEVSENRNVAVLLTEKGGHVGFLGKPVMREDHRWAENRVIQFVETMHAVRPGRGE
jgi:uncharacterized protein